MTPNAPWMEKMNQTQLRFMAEMRSNLEFLHDEWYFSVLPGHFGGRGLSERTYDLELYTDVKRRIEAACQKLGIVVVKACDPDGWDGERNGDFVTLADALDAIQDHFAGIRRPFLGDDHGCYHEGF
jgi:hypothetical protein